MREFDQWCFPEGETHLPEWMETVQDRRDGRLLYQGHKYRMATRFVKRRRVAVDVGAHIGLWSWQMAQDFERVIAFEPVPAHTECWLRNMADCPNAWLEAVALGHERGMVALHNGTEGSSGDTWVARDDDAPNAAGEVYMGRLDDFAERIGHVDFLKIDNEGYEYFVLLGGEALIRECKPVVIVEQKPGMAQKFGLGETQAVDLLISWGARRRAAKQGDFVLSW